MLRPSVRSGAGYRVYGPDDVARLTRICEYRQVGLPLDAVRRVLDESDDVAAALAVRLAALDREAREVQRQRRAILDYLDDTRTAPVERFTALLAAVGMDSEQQARWHAAFERADPVEHQELLEFLRLPEESIARVRARARAAGEAPRPAQRRSRSTSVS